MFYKWGNFFLGFEGYCIIFSHLMLYSFILFNNVLRVMPRMLEAFVRLPFVSRRVFKIRPFSTSLIVAPVSNPLCPPLLRGESKEGYDCIAIGRSEGAIYSPLLIITARSIAFKLPYIPRPVVALHKAEGLRMKPLYSFIIFSL